MKYKRSINGFLIVLLGLSVLIPVINAAAQDTAVSNDEAVFIKRFTQFNTAGIAMQKKRLSKPTPEFIEAASKFYNFPNDFPRSRYAADVRYMRMLFTKDQYNIAEWEKFVKRYPDGCLQDLTLEMYGKAYGQVPNDMYIPYRLVLLYWKSSKAWVKDMDYSKAVRGLSEYIKLVDYGDPNEKKSVLNAYYGLFYCYSKLGKKAEFDDAKEKAQELFPDKKPELEKVPFFYEQPANKAP